MSAQSHKVYSTADGIGIYVAPGTKSENDFIVRYWGAQRKRTPKHIHLVIDLYMKSVGNKVLTMQLVDHIIENIIQRVQLADAFPPSLQVFSPEHVHKFEQPNRTAR